MFGLIVLELVNLSFSYPVIIFDKILCSFQKKDQFNAGPLLLTPPSNP
jgi:hypothetical protein